MTGYLWNTFFLHDVQWVSFETALLGNHFLDERMNNRGLLWTFKGGDEGVGVKEETEAISKSIRSMWQGVTKAKQWMEMPQLFYWV